MAVNERTRKTSVGKKIRTRWQRASRAVRVTIIILVVLLVSLRLGLPYLIEDYVNRQLAKIPEYSGHIGTVTVSLWRGAYVIHGINIRKTEGNIPVPFFSTPRMDLSVQWKELFHGAIVGKVLLDKPQVNFVGGPTKEQSQTGESQPWEKTLASLFPFQINRFEIKQGDVRFKTFAKSEPVDIYVTNLNAVATNLTNARVPNQPLPAGLKATGSSLGGGELTIDLKMNPLASGPTFQVDATLTNVDLVALNSFLRSYGKFDVAGGEFSVYTTAASDNGTYKGVIKVLFKHLDVFEWDKERKKNILQIFWEGIIGAVATTFKNHPHDQLAANIPISGQLTNSHVAVLYAVGSTLHNAFIRALVPSINHSEKLEDVEKKGNPALSEPGSTNNPNPAVTSTNQPNDSEKALSPKAEQAAKEASP